MILKKKGNDIYQFSSEQELKDYCANSNVKMSDFKPITVKKYDARLKLFKNTNL